MFYLIATPIGNIADIGIRALSVLESCDEILCEDTRIAKKLIALLNARGLLKKADFRYTSFHSHNESLRLKGFGAEIERLGADFFSKNVAYLSDAGMPCISDPGAKLVAFLQENGLPYSAVSGACSVVLAFALSGFEGGFSFLGFIPHKLSDKRVFLRNMLESPLHCVCFESPKRILDSLKLLCEFARERKIFIAKELSKMHEKFYFGKVGEVLARLQSENLKGEWVLVISAEQGRVGRLSDEAQNANLGANQTKKSLNRFDIEALDIPPKIKAKLIARIEGCSPKECYEELLNEKK